MWIKEKVVKMNDRDTAFLQDEREKMYHNYAAFQIYLLPRPEHFW